MASLRNRKVFTGLTMASSLAWMSILPATAVFAAQAGPTVTPGSVTLSGPIHPTNGSATFTASASDPNGTAEYQFWVESPTGQWSDMQNYSTNNTFTLATTMTGDYLVAVDVMDQAQVAAGDWNMAQTTLPDGVFNGSTLSVQSNASGSVAQGQTVTLTATASGIFSPLYQFWYQSPDGTWHQSGAYQSSNTFSFTAGQSGTYQYVAYVKSPLAANNPHGALQSNVGSQVAYGTASQVVLTLASPSVVANASATDLLTATVEDSNGNRVANFSGTVNVLEQNPQGKGGLFGVSGTTASVGLANGSGTVAIQPNAFDGNYTYTLTSDNLQSAATSAGGTAGQGVAANVMYGSATVMTTAPSDKQLGLVSTLPNLESNAQSSTTVWVQLKDRTGAAYDTQNGQYVQLTLGGSASGSFSASSAQPTTVVEVQSGTSQFPVTLYSETGSNGTITVMAQSNDEAVTPLVTATLNIPVVEVGTPAAVQVRQIGTSNLNGTPAVVYQADVVDANGNTVSLGSGSAASGYIQDNSLAVNSTSALQYLAYEETPGGLAPVPGAALGSSPGPNPETFSGGAVDIAVATLYHGNGTPLTLTVHNSTSGVSGTTIWHFAAPTAAYTESLPTTSAAYEGSHELAYGTVTAGATADVSAQLVDQYGNAIQEAGQPIWFTLGGSTSPNTVTLPNGAGQPGDTYEAFTNSQGVASIPLTVLSGASPYADFYVKTSTTVGFSAPEEYGVSYTVEPPSNYVARLALNSGGTVTVPAGTPLSSLSATLLNALGGIASGNYFADEIQVESSNSGVVSVGSGANASAGEILLPPSPYLGEVTAPQGTSEGLYAGIAGTATITVTDVSNAAMPSASFTVKVVPGSATTMPWIEYQGQHVSSTNEVPLPPNTPVELQVVNVDQGGNPVPVTGTGSLAVQLPVLPSGEYWQASSGGVSSSSMVVDIKPSQSSANVWLVSSTSANVSGPAYGQDQTSQAMATGATVVTFTQATTSSNGSMTIDLAYNAPLASGTVASGSAFTVTDSAVSGATLSGTAAMVSGSNMVALTVTIPSGSTDASVDPFDAFTVTTSASAVDSTANGGDYVTAPVSASTSGAVNLPTLSTSRVTAAAPESESLNQTGSTATATISGTTYSSLAYAASTTDFATISAGGAAVLTPSLVTGATVTPSGGTAVSGQTLAVWTNSGGTPAYFVDLTNEAPPSSAQGAAYVGFTVTAPTGDAVIWSSQSGKVVSDNNNSSTDYLYVPVATGTTGSTTWSIPSAQTFANWVEVNGTFYTFTTTQP